MNYIYKKSLIYFFGLTMRIFILYFFINHAFEDLEYNFKIFNLNTDITYELSSLSYFIDYNYVKFFIILFSEYLIFYSITSIDKLNNPYFLYLYWLNPIMPFFYFISPESIILSVLLISTFFCFYRMQLFRAGFLATLSIFLFPISLIVIPFFFSI